MSTGPHLCRCDPPRVAEMKTSWTNKNPGRRFVRCPFHQQEQGCNFWMWYDPPMCERALVVIPGLLRKIRNLEMEVSNLSEACNSKEGHESVENYINNKEQNECVESCHESTPTMIMNNDVHFGQVLLQLQVVVLYFELTVVVHFGWDWDAKSNSGNSYAGWDMMSGSLSDGI
ncbi:hypothetical protein G4B88_002509 [Cannabis sativa]|uniref:GRF-type domain-containing protein n=1 Tax=Cannabis sativa TaxID=3483 RepID=A0A7J6I8K9_CANSA|nr:hypothetical protein G4B88_002509 [Cannabis sativa]